MKRKKPDKEVCSLCGFGHGHGITPCSICNDGDKGWFPRYLEGDAYMNMNEPDYFQMKDGSKLRSMNHPEVKTEEDLEKLRKEKWPYAIPT